jgi:hypothetical protein
VSGEAKALIVSIVIAVLLLCAVFFGWGFE